MTETEKSLAVKEFMEITGKHCLTFFKMMGLSSHIEQMFIDQNDNDKEYVLSFKTIEKHLLDRETDTIHPISKVIFFNLKDGKYLTETGTEITTAFLLKHKHFVFDNGGYIVLQ